MVNLECAYLYIHNFEVPDKIVRVLIDGVEDHLELAVYLSSTLRPIAVALHPSLLLLLGQHDDGGTLVLPDHPPEVL